jgi:hypothetical protein
VEGFDEEDMIRLYYSSMAMTKKILVKITLKSLEIVNEENSLCFGLYDVL